MSVTEPATDVGLSALEDYLRAHFDRAARILELNAIGKTGAEYVKRYGCGTAVEVVYAGNHDA